MTMPPIWHLLKKWSFWPSYFKKPVMSWMEMNFWRRKSVHKLSFWNQWFLVGTQTFPFSKFTRIEQKCVLVLGRSPQTKNILPGFLAACARASLNWLEMWEMGIRNTFLLLWKVIQCLSHLKCFYCLSQIWVCLGVERCWEYAKAESKLPACWK